MVTNRLGKKSVKKTILTATAVIGTSTLLFMGILHAVTAAEYKKTNTIPTNYVSYIGDSMKTVQNSMPKGYKKANYTVGAIELEYYRNQTPTSKDMNKEDAAEIGAQVLWGAFDVNLEGQVIKMGYQQATDSLPRSTWYAEVIIDGKRSYYFSVDSVTGELFSLGRADRALIAENVSVVYDEALDKNPQEFVSLAKELVEKYNPINGAVKSVKYNGQGYSNNVPTVSIDITGENGEIALLTFSRYDKELLGIVYNASYKPSLEYTEILQEK